MVTFNNTKTESSSWADWVCVPSLRFNSLNQRHCRRQGEAESSFRTLPVGHSARSGNRTYHQRDDIPGFPSRSFISPSTTSTIFETRTLMRPVYVIRTSLLARATSAL